MDKERVQFFGTEPPNASTLITSDFGGWDIYDEYFDIAPATLGPGTYYLDFLAGDTTAGEEVGWDISNKLPATADQWSSGGEHNSGLASTTFALLGPGESPVPEPSSLLLLGSGVTALAGMIRRKLKA